MGMKQTLRMNIIIFVFFMAESHKDRYCDSTIGILVFFFKNVLFILEDCASIFLCHSHIQKHKFQTSTITLVVSPTLPHCSPLRFLFQQRSLFTEESGNLCNDVLEVFVMDGSYCISMLVTLLHFGAVCCTMPFLILEQFFSHSGFLHSAGTCAARDLIQYGISNSAGSCTARDLIQHGISCSTGSCTLRDLVQHVISYSALILDTQGQHKNERTNDN
jgi:hypothetical protein